MDSLVKITDRTEIMPSLDRVRVYQLLVTFRDHCLETYNDIYLSDFDKKKIDSRFGVLHSSSDSYFDIRGSVLSSFGYDPKSFKPIDCLVELLLNPRTLKRSLAHTWDAWKKLHGEIYFDDLLIVHTIRTTAPRLFELIASDIHLFRLFVKTDSKHKSENLYLKVENALKDYGIDSYMYHNLLRFLFPSWKIPSENHNKRLANYVFADESHTQGIALCDVTDYFYRLNAEELSDDEQSDQKTMQTIKDFNNGKMPASKFINEISDNANLMNKIEQFGDLLLPSRVLELTSQYFDFIPSYDYRRLLDFKLTGMLWRIHFNNPEKPKSYRKWLKAILTKYLQVNIRFADDIYYLWKYRNNDESSRKNASPYVHKMYLDTFKKEFQGKPEKLIDALPSDPPFIWVLRHIIFKGLDNNEILGCENKDTFFADWHPWFVELLIDASKIDPKLIAIYSVPLVYNVDKSGKIAQSQWEGEIDARVSNLLFGDNLTNVIRNISILSEDDYSTYELDSQAIAILDFAVAHSKSGFNK